MPEAEPDEEELDEEPDEEFEEDPFFPVTWSILLDALSVTLLTVSLTFSPTSEAARPAKSFTSPFTLWMVSESVNPRHLLRRSS